MLRRASKLLTVASHLLYTHTHTSDIRVLISYQERPPNPPNCHMLRTLNNSGVFFRSVNKFCYAVYPRCDFQWEHAHTYVLLLQTASLDWNKKDVKKSLGTVEVCMHFCVCGDKRGTFHGRGWTRLIPDVTVVCVCQRTMGWVCSTCAWRGQQS